MSPNAREPHSAVEPPDLRPKAGPARDREPHAQAALPAQRDAVAPANIRPARILTWQATAGNRAVGRLLARSPKVAPPITNVTEPWAPLEDAVYTFKERLVIGTGAAAPTNTQLLRRGQFYWTYVVRQQLDKRVAELLAPLRSTVPFVATPATALQSRFDELSKAASEMDLTASLAGPVAAVKTETQSLKDAALKASLDALVGSGAVSEADGAKIHADAWKHYAATKTDPDFRQQPKLDYTALAGLRRSELNRCFETAGEVAKAARASPPADKGLSTTGWSSLTANPVDPKEKPLPSGKLALVWGDLVPKNSLPKAIVDEAAQALDAGWYVRAGVISGVSWERAPAGKPPRYDHYLVLVGHDADTFVFWDPDSTASPLHKGGFGELYYRDGRLTTASSESDLPVWDVGAPGGKEGDHQKGGQHRYQVLSLGRI